MRSDVTYGEIVSTNVMGKHIVCLCKCDHFGKPPQIQGLSAHDCDNGDDCEAGVIHDLPRFRASQTGEMSERLAA